MKRNLKNLQYITQRRGKMVKISVIIPVYNSEKYLERCLKSEFLFITAKNILKDALNRLFIKLMKILR